MMIKLRMWRSFTSQLRLFHVTLTILLASLLSYVLMRDFSKNRSEGWTAVHVFDGIDKTLDQQLISIPRGQSFFYVTSESRRLGSFETWRPPHLVRRLTRSTTTYDDSDNIFVAIQTESKSMWQHVPLQLLTNLQVFPSFGIYGDLADSIGGVEIVDVFRAFEESILDKSPDFEPYAILQSIRDSHVIIPPDQVSIPGANKLGKYQMLPMLEQVYSEHPHHDWYVIIDDKTSLFSRTLRAVLAELDPSQPYYLGSPVQGELVFASLNSGIVLSRGLMDLVFEGNRERIYGAEYLSQTSKECCGDYVLAKFLRDEFHIDLDVETSANFFEMAPLPDVKVRAHNWCSPVCSLGQQRLRDMEVIAEYDDVKAGVILHSDLYLDFIKPYLTAESQHNWDNGANDLEFGPGHNLSADAHKSLAHCRQTCAAISQCTMLRYDTYAHYCGLGLSSVALGGPILRYKVSKDAAMCALYGTQCESRKPNEPMISEWDAQRIRAMRTSLACDVLHMDAMSEGSEFGALDQVEGWWHRASASHM